MSSDFEQRIDDYLLNNMTHQEQLEFEKAMTTNDALKKQISIRSIEIKGIKLAGRDQLKNRLKIIHDQTQKAPTKKRNLLPYVSGIAAAIALLLAAGFYLFIDNNTNPEALFTQHYEPYVLSLSSRDAADNQIAQLSEYYNNKNYKAALPLFEKILTDDATNARMLLGAGICNLELNQFMEARKHFSTIISINDIRLQDMAKWYIALSFLKENNPTAATPFLDQVLENPRADKYKEAKQLKTLLAPE